ncbi:hypothetical protein ACIRU8_13400 [Streptomyces sp. NPDC101175]|uniref:hypothetical protein n=1 Tax=Streptomyces sp. NPDC101175 TaxID=3366123 RepID=UPI003833A699
MADQQKTEKVDRHDDPSVEPWDVVNLIGLATKNARAEHPAGHVKGDARNSLEELRQGGALPLEDLARVRASMSGQAPEHRPQWATGFTAGYLAAWAAAVLRVLDTRGVEYDKHLFRALNLCSDAELLTLYLDRAVTATDDAQVVDVRVRRKMPGER